MTMGTTEMILQMAKENNGMITTSMVDQAGLSRGNLKYLVDNAKLEKSSRGVYTLPGVWEDEFINLQTRFKRGIFSHETALFLYDLSNQTPNYYCMTFPSTYNVSLAKKEKIRCSQVIEPLYEVGITNIKSPSGNTVRVYNREKTLCDILKPRCQMDIQIVTDAYKQYAKQKDRNIPLLSEYAKQLNVESRIRAYLEVFL